MIAKYPKSGLRIVEQTNLSIDLPTADIFLCSINSNSSYTFTSMSAGQSKLIRVLNSHATNAVTITNPTASNWIIQNGLTTVTLLAGEYVEATVIFYGTNYRLIYGEALKKNA